MEVLKKYCEKHSIDLIERNIKIKSQNDENNKIIEYFKGDNNIIVSLCSKSTIIDNSDSIIEVLNKLKNLSESCQNKNECCVCYQLTYGKCFQCNYYTCTDCIHSYNFNYNIKEIQKILKGNVENISKVHDFFREKGFICPVCKINKKAIF